MKFHSMNARRFYTTAFISGSIGLASFVSFAQPAPISPAPATAPVPSASTTISTQGRQASAESKDPLIIRIDPARVLDSSGQSVGKIESIVLSPSGCADAVVITGERG